MGAGLYLVRDRAQNVHNTNHQSITNHLVPKSVVSKSGFRKAAPLSGP
jgi:hypothetical protein